MSQPPQDDYPHQLERVMRGAVNEGIEAGAGVLKPIAYRRRDVARRPSLSRAVIGRVFRRDHFYCRYCAGKTIPAPKHRHAEDERDDQRGEAHGAMDRRGEHGHRVLALQLSQGDLTLAQIGWTLRDVPDEPWDGLTGFYLNLWEVAGRPKQSYHEDWMRVLGALLGETAEGHQSQ